MYSLGKMTSWQFALVIVFLILFFLSWVIYLSVRIKRLKAVIRELEGTDEEDGKYSETGDVEGRG